MQSKENFDLQTVEMFFFNTWRGCSSLHYRQLYWLIQPQRWNSASPDRTNQHLKITGINLQDIHELAACRQQVLFYFEGARRLSVHRLKSGGSTPRLTDWLTDWLAVWPSVYSDLDFRTERMKSHDLLSMTAQNLTSPMQYVSCSWILQVVIIHWCILHNKCSK